MPEFLVLIGCNNDATGKRFEPGVIVTEVDFPEAVISNWVEIGVLQAVAPAKPTSEIEPEPQAGTGADQIGPVSNG